MDIHIINADWQQHQNALQEIRHAVFIEEQGIPLEEEYDVEDRYAAHFLAVNSLGQYLGCARLLDSGQIGRMAVLKEQRGTGLGRLLLEAAIEAARERKLDKVFLHAQKYAEPFYRKCGFVINGPEFSEVGIPHVPMEMVLPLAFDPPPIQHQVKTRPLAEPEQETKQRESQHQEFSDHDGALDALCTLLLDARRDVLIFSPLLDHDLFAQPRVIQALSDFARSGRRAQVKILLQSSKLAIDRGHSLVELCRRLDDCISIRKLDEPINEETSSFVCADLDGYWVLPAYDTYRGHTDRYNPVLTNRMRDTFKQAWERSVTDPELRILRL